MRIEDLIDKFEHYAKTLKSVKHDPSDRMQCAFLHLDMEDLDDSLINGLKFPAIVIQSPEFSKGGNYDNLSEAISFTFLVLKSGSDTSKLLKITESKAIADLLYSRLLIDVNTDEKLYGTIIGTDEGVWGPKGNIWGWGVSCEISAPFSGELKPEDWMDLEMGVSP